MLSTRCFCYPKECFFAPRWNATISCTLTGPVHQVVHVDLVAPKVNGLIRPAIGAVERAVNGSHAKASHVEAEVKTGSRSVPNGWWKKWAAWSCTLMIGPWEWRKLSPKSFSLIIDSLIILIFIPRYRSRGNCRTQSLGPWENSNFSQNAYLTCKYVFI